MKRNVAKGTEIQFDQTVTLDPQTLLPRSDREISSREWLMLAVVCLQAADQAKVSGDLLTERRYSDLARKCDRAAEPDVQDVQTDLDAAAWR